MEHLQETSSLRDAVVVEQVGGLARGSLLGRGTDTGGGHHLAGGAQVQLLANSTMVRLLPRDLLETSSPSVLIARLKGNVPPSLGGQVGFALCPPPPGLTV